MPISIRELCEKELPPTPMSEWSYEDLMVEVLRCGGGHKFNDDGGLKSCPKDNEVCKLVIEKNITA